ncbi:uncharacterized protein [Chiloscyllium punctatum]|uniref:uncharacterized protein isoform X2 n=1 Tax=Chiloscyllium punctatum TaxID=137246 RepID=UPI003B633E1C
MVASPPFLKGRDPPPQTERERILCSGLLPVSRGSLLCASRVWGSFTRRGAGEQGGCSMESQNQSSLVTSSGENGDAAVSSSGVSLDNLLSSSSQHISVTEERLQLQTLLSGHSLSAQQPSCVSVSESMGSFQPSALGSVVTSDMLSGQGGSSALIPSLKKTALSDTEKECFGSAVTQGMSNLYGNDSVKDTTFRGSQPGGSVFDNYSWMSQPELVFGKQESQRVPEAVEVCQIESVHHGTGAVHAPEEPAKSDPSSIDSSQEEDSLERISPDSPFEVLAEMQEKGPCAEETPKSSFIVDERRVDLNLPQKPLPITGGIKTDPLSEAVSKNKAKTVAAIGPKSDLKTGDLPQALHCSQVGDQQEIPDGQSNITEDVFRPNATTGGGMSMDIASKSFQPSVCGSMSRPQDLIFGDPVSQPFDKRKVVCGLQMDLDLSERIFQPARGPGTDGLSPYSLIKITPDEAVNPSVQIPTSTSAGIKILPDVGHGCAIDPVSRSSEPLAEVPSRDPMDEPQPLKKEAKEISPSKETCQLPEDPTLSWGSSQCPTLEGTTTLDHVLSARLETAEADSSGESDDTVIEDVKSGPVGTLLYRKEKSDDIGTTEKLVCAPVLNVRESREQVLSDRQRESVNLQSTGPGGDRTQSAETKDHPAETPILSGASPGLGHSGDMVLEQIPITSQEVVPSDTGVSPYPSAAASHQLDMHMSTEEGTGECEPRSSSPILSTLSHVDQSHWHPPGLSPTDPATTQLSADSPVSVDGADTEELSIVEGPSPLQEMIWRSAISQRGHVLGGMQPAPVATAPTQTIIVKSTPIVIETPSLIVKSTSGPGGALEGVAEGTERTLEGAAEGTERTLEGVAEGTERTLEGAAEGPERALEGVAEGTERTLEGAAEGPAKAPEGATDGPAKAPEGVATGAVRAQEGAGEGAAKASDSMSSSSVGLTGVQQPATRQEVTKPSPSGRRDTQNGLRAKDGQSLLGSGDRAQPQLTTTPQALSKLTPQQYPAIEKTGIVKGTALCLAQPLVDTAPPSDSKVRPELKPQTVLEPVQMERPVGGAASDRLSKMAVKDLIYWRDPKKTGVVFGSILTLLVSLAVFSVVSVLAYLVLALLSVTISFRIYKSVVQAVQKTNDGNPFKPYLEQDITLSSETFHKYCTIGFTHLNRVLKYLLQLFLVQDLVDSLKLAVLMWLMTYVGAVFNGLTLLILAVLLTFSVPIIYQAYQTQIDHYIELVQKQAVCAFGKIQEKLPGAKRKSE